jgi:outer membrane protein assembly factor BamB
MKRLVVVSLLAGAVACAGGCGATPWWKYRSNLSNNGLGSASSLQGKVKWKFPTGGLVFTSPALDDNNVYFGSDDMSFYAVSKGGGLGVWSFATGGRVESSALVTSGVVYFGSSDKNVYALATAGGAKLWSFATGGEVLSSPTFGGLSLPDPKHPGTLYNQNIVIVGSMDGSVYAIDADTGKRRWVFATHGPVQSSPAWSPSGNIYVGSNDHNVYALDPTSGAKLWTFATNDEVHASPAVGTDGTVYIPSDDGSLYALDGATGAKKWAFTPSATPRKFLTPAAVLFASNVDTIFSGNGNGFFAVDAAGKQLWLNTQWAGLGSLSPPAVTGDPTIYVGSFTGFNNTSQFVAADARTGNLRWAFFALNGGLFLGGAAVDSDGTVYTGCTDGNLYAFQ